MIAPIKKNKSTSSHFLPPTLTIIPSQFTFKMMLEGSEKHNFPLTSQKHNLKLSTFRGICNFGIYISPKSVCLLDISWPSCQYFCLMPASLLACIAINFQVIGCKGRSLLCSLINELEDANIRLLTLN